MYVSSDIECIFNVFLCSKFFWGKSYSGAVGLVSDWYRTKNHTTISMKLSSAASALALASTIGVSAARVKKYCAKIDPETADGAKGKP